MRWTQLKKRLEGTFAACVQGRVEVWTTRYRHAHDGAGEAWITFDKERVLTFGSWHFEVEHSRMAWNLQKAVGATNWRDPNQLPTYHAASDLATVMLHDQGTLAQWNAHRAFFEYLNLSIEQILSSENHIIRALGMLDRRFGVRRVRVFDPLAERELVRVLHAIRLKCEGLPSPDGIAPMDSSMQS